MKITVDTNEILKITDTSELEAKITEISNALLSEGNQEKAYELRKLIPVATNRFSKIGQKELLETTKRKLIGLLENDSISKTMTEVVAIDTVGTLLGNIKNYFELMFRKTSHAKCSKHISDIQKVFEIENEYDLQHYLYALLRSVFPLVRIEENQDTGVGTVRKDIAIDEFDIAIELKCTRNSMDLRKLSEEVASDIIHYDNKNLFFLIYDKAHIIENADLFKIRYENTNIDKRVRIYIFSIH
ncbi:hypothetical protein [Oribacterium sp. FC2011]|uniref:PD-(D/E)XK nuclease domain-containing protein n=1 Tax=Oribacterium sp. FC2011 TaxID=1408311 RepID=UPI000678A644|nr:hypothetical protein [Oribacterium sp. FC2011]